MLPMLSLNSYTGYRAYFENIANQHVDIQGFKYGNQKVVQNASRKGLANIFLHCLPYEDARYTGFSVDHQYRRKRARYAVMKVSGGDAFEKENEDLDIVEAIALQINARLIYYDKIALRVIIDVNTLSMRAVEDITGSTKYRGIEVSVDVLDNPGMSVNVDKWNDLTTP
jgi:hypothetical protein